MCVSAPSAKCLTLLSLWALGACSPRGISLGAFAPEGLDDPWLVAVSGPGDQVVSAVAQGRLGVVVAAGQEPGLDIHEGRSNVFLTAIDRGNRRWTRTASHQDFGESDVAAALLSGPEGIWLVGTAGEDSEDAMAFRDVHALDDGALISALRLFVANPCQPPACDPTFIVDVATAAVSEQDLFVGGSLRGVTLPAPAWLNQPALESSPPWAIVAASRDAQALWATTLDKVGIQKVTSMSLMGGQLLVVATGTATADNEENSALWVFVLDPASGEVVDERLIVTGEGLLNARLAVTPSGPVLAVQFEGPLAVAGQPIVSISNADVCAVGLSEDDFAPRWALALGGSTLRPGGHAIVALDDGDVMVGCGTCVSRVSKSLASVDDAGPGLVRLSPQGTVRSIEPLPHQGDVRLEAMARTQQSASLIVGGAFNGQIGLPGGALGGVSNGWDGFVLQMPVPQP